MAVASALLKRARRPRRRPRKKSFYFQPKSFWLISTAIHAAGELETFALSSFYSRQKDS